MVTLLIDVAKLEVPRRLGPCDKGAARLALILERHEDSYGTVTPRRLLDHKPEAKEDRSAPVGF